MSIQPIFFELPENHPFDDAFGFMVYPGQIHKPKLRRYQSLNGYSRPISKREYALKPRHILHKCQKAADLNTNFDKDGFQVFLDVKDFAPNEILVKTIDQTVVVEGKHEEKEDEHGHISRHFVRKYTLPKEVDVNEVISTLSTDGQLTIKAPPKPKAVKSGERIIQIQQSGEAHQPLKSKEVEKVVMNDDETAQ